MSEIDEGLDAGLEQILDWYAIKYNEQMRILPIRKEAMQAILNLMCKHRGHSEQPMIFEHTARDSTGKGIEGRWYKRPCKWCGKEAM